MTTGSDRALGAGMVWIAVWVCVLAGCATGSDGVPRIVANAGAALERAAQATVEWVESTVDSVVESARGDVTRTHGVFVYTPGVGDALCGDWSGIESVERTRSAVVLVHGLDEPGDVWCTLAPALYDAGHTVIRFDYPNDQAIERSGTMMFEAMRTVRGLGIERVFVVGHSMGGLVTREMLTGANLYAGAAEVDGVPRVESLIAVGTPFQGSTLARFRALGEVRDHLVRWIDISEGDPRALLGFLFDGRGEAGEDLLPGSAYLVGAADRSISSEIAVTSIVGRALPMSGDGVRRALDGTWLAGAIGEGGVGAMARAADRAAGCVGDGVVTEGSACGFAGGESVVVHANHRSLVRCVGPVDALATALGLTAAEPPAIAEILARVGEAR